MNYELPNNKSEFIDRYRLSERVFESQSNQAYIRNYSGLNSLDFGLNDSIHSYLDSGNISINSGWEKELDTQIINFYNRICNNEKILEEGDFTEKAIVCSETYVEDEVNGEKIRKSIGGCGGPLYSEVGESINQFINTYGRLFFNYLGTEEKLLMCKAQNKYGLQDNNTNFLSEIQFNSEILSKLSNYTKMMFKKDIYLDRYSWGNKILFRVGENFDFIKTSTRDDTKVEYQLKDFNILDFEGDGIKNFVTSYLTLNLNDKNILLLDEPETFLHPPLANQLGEIIGQSSSNSKQIFISTHSVDLLKGILRSCDDINIIRITRDGNLNLINQLDKEKINSILLNPLLASANILNGLFCEKVYICEAESDEEFYQALHDKVNLLDSSLFVHGKNKQTLKDIANIYNDLKIKNFRIYDFDILKDEDFNRALNGFIPKDIKDKYILLRKTINSKLIDKSLYNNRGIRVMEKESIFDDLNCMLDELKMIGIIILKNGCLESNFEDVGIQFTSNKTNWFSDAMDFIRSADESQLQATYIYNLIFN